MEQQSRLCHGCRRSNSPFALCTTGTVSKQSRLTQSYRPRKWPWRCSSQHTTLPSYSSPASISPQGENIGVHPTLSTTSANLMGSPGLSSSSEAQPIPMLTGQGQQAQEPSALQLPASSPLPHASQLSFPWQSHPNTNPAPGLKSVWGKSRSRPTKAQLGCTLAAPSKPILTTCAGFCFLGSQTPWNSKVLRVPDLSILSSLYISSQSRHKETWSRCILIFRPSGNSCFA